jgi:hypothetical protein
MPVYMPQPRRIPPVRPSSGGGEESSTSAAARRESEPVGKLLLQANAITRPVLDAALAAQRKSFKPLGRILRDDANLPPDALLAALKKQTHVPRIFLRFFRSAWRCRILTSAT